MRRLVPTFAALGLLAPHALAQLPKDTWVATCFNSITTGVGGGIFLVSADRSTLTVPANPTPDMQDANCAVADGDGVVYYGTLQSGSLAAGPNQGNIFQVWFSGATVAAEVRLTTQAPDTGSVSGITLRGDQIWYVTDSGNVGWIPVPSASNPPPYAPNNVYNINSQGGVGGLGQSITTDGRDLFIGVSVSASSTDPYSIWALDAEDPTTLRGIALPDSRSVFDMSMGHDGEIFAGLFGGRLYSIDPITGTSNYLNSSAPAPQGNANGASMNPWTDEAGAVPGFGSTGRQLDHFDLVTATWLPNLAGPIGLGVPSGVTSATELPFELFGKGCAGRNGLEPRVRWRGLAAQGRSFDITLRDADPSAPCFFVLGFTSLTGPLTPVDLGPIGAPGCYVLTSSDLAVMTTVDPMGDGVTSLTVPTSPSLNGGRLHAQFVLITGANPLGVTLTEGIHIRVR